MSLDRRQFAELTMAFGGVELSAGEVWREFARPVRVLPQPQLLPYLSFHAYSHFYSMTLVRLVELVLVGRRDFAGRPDRWEAFSDLVRRTRIGRFVFPALALAERLTPGSVDPLVLEELVAAAPPRLRRLVRHVTPASPPPPTSRALCRASFAVGSLARSPACTRDEPEPTHEPDRAGDGEEPPERAALQQAAADARADHSAPIGSDLTPARDGSLALAGRLPKQPLVDQRIRHRGDQSLQPVEQDGELHVPRE